MTQAVAPCPELPLRFVVDDTSDPLRSVKAIVVYGYDGCFPESPGILLRTTFEAKRNTYLKRNGPPDWRAVVLVDHGTTPSHEHVRSLISAKAGGGDSDSIHERPHEGVRDGHEHQET